MNNKSILIIVVIVILVFGALMIFNAKKPLLSPQFSTLQEYFSYAQQNLVSISDTELLSLFFNALSYQVISSELSSILQGLTESQLAGIIRGDPEDIALVSGFSTPQQNEVLSLINNIAASQQALLFKPSRDPFSEPLPPGEAKRPIPQCTESTLEQKRCSAPGPAGNPPGGIIQCQCFEEFPSPPESCAWVLVQQCNCEYVNGKPQCKATKNVA